MAASVFGRPLAQPGSSAGACCADATPAAHSAAHATNERKVFIACLQQYVTERRRTIPPPRIASGWRNELSTAGWNSGNLSRNSTRGTAAKSRRASRATRRRPAPACWPSDAARGYGRALVSAPSAIAPRPKRPSRRRAARAARAEAGSMGAGRRASTCRRRADRPSTCHVLDDHTR